MHQGALQVLGEIVAGLPQFSADQQEVCCRCALGECTKVEWIDRDPQAPDSQQDLVQGAVSQVAGGPNTVTAETPGSGESQVTGSGTQGTGMSLVPGGYWAGYSGEYKQQYRCRCSRSWHRVAGYRCGTGS